MKVKIVDGHKIPPTGYGPGLDFYMRRNNMTAKPKCARQGCEREASDGVCVEIADSKDWDLLHYSIPLCNDCKSFHSAFEIDGDVKPVIMPSGLM